MGQLITENHDINLKTEISWLNNDIRNANVEKLQTFLPTLFNNLNLNDFNTWKTFMNSHECENAFSPEIEKRLSEFQKLLVIQALRPDRLYSAMNKFALLMIGNNFYNKLNLNLKFLFF